MVRNGRVDMPGSNRVGYGLYAGRSASSPTAAGRD